MEASQTPTLKSAVRRCCRMRTRTRDGTGCSLRSRLSGTRRRAIDRGTGTASVMKTASTRAALDELLDVFALEARGLSCPGRERKARRSVRREWPAP